MGGNAAALLAGQGAEFSVMASRIARNAALRRTQMSSIAPSTAINQPSLRLISE
jgi:hypothetical protein